jgi:hypothetical protein
LIPIHHYINRCISRPQRDFVRVFPHPVLVYEPGARELEPVEELARRTVDRLPPMPLDLLENQESDFDKATLNTPSSDPGNLYQVIELRPARDASASVSIGCGRECDARINDRTLSRIHAYLETREGKQFIWDNSSAAGTRLNDKPLEEGQLTELKSGDQITLGTVRLTYLDPEGFYKLLRALFVD